MHFKLKNNKKISIISIIILSVIAICIISFSFNINIKKSYANSSSMTVHFLDVGEANCIYISSNNMNMLIDAGNYYDGEYIIDYLKDHNISKLDYVIASHAHEDHIGSMNLIIDTFDIGTFIMPSKQHTTSAYTKMLKSLVQKNIPITRPIANSTYKLGYGYFTVLSTDMDPLSTSINNSSVVVKVCDNNNSFLIGGDIEIDMENQLLDNNVDLSADVFLLNHHGSNTSNSTKFLKAVNPSHAIISVASQNSYGFPNKEVLKRLEKLNIPYLSTANCGNIIAYSNGKTINFSTNY